MSKIKKQKFLHTTEQVVEGLKLPKDMVYGASIITMVGDKEVTIENYKGILEYSKECIIVQGKTCQIGINGKNLSIDYYTNDDMKISGIIECLKYIN